MADNTEYIVTLKGRVVDLEKELAWYEGELDYVHSCLHALLTGDMPEVSDLTQMLYAVRGRKCLAAEEELKILKEKDDSTHVQRESSCLEAKDRNSDRH